MYSPIAGVSPSVEIVSRLVKNTTSNGIIIVVRKITKIVRGNGNSKNANAYAARIAVSSCPPTMRIVTINELRRYEPTLPSVHASAYAPQSGLSGGHGLGGRWAMRSGGDNEFTTVM